MNKEPKISVIIPVYNVEKYLHRCIDSILAQTFTDFELLLIDDGSKDNSGKICDEYAEKDKRIRVFHKENGGASIARNVGIEYCIGEYIIFVDSDDYISANYLGDLIESVSSSHISLVLQSPIRVYQDGRKETNDLQKFVFSGHEGLKNFIEYGFLKYSEPHSKLFRSCIIKLYNIEFPKGIIIGEDGIFISQYLKYTDTIVISDKHGYYYSKYGSSVQSKIYNYNLEKRGFIQWKESLESLFYSVQLYNHKTIIWNLLSVPMRRFIISVSLDSTLNMKQKIGLLRSLKISDYDNYGLGRIYGLNGKIFKYIINHKLYRLIIYFVNLKKIL